MWHGRNVGNRSNTDTQCRQSANRGLTAWPRAFDFNIQILDALILGCTTSHFRSYLSRKRGRFARALEALPTGRCPRQRITLTIGNRNNGIVKRGMNVSNTIRDIFTDLFAHALSSIAGGRLSHVELSSNSELLLQSLCSLARAFTSTRISTRALPTHRQATTMTKATIASNIHQTLNIHGGFATKITFNQVLSNLIANFLQISIRQIFDLLGVANPACLANFTSTRTPNAINCSQPDLGVLMRRNINTSNSCHL